ncbi:hypothetical protein [Chitinolyticbacter meiyuanensis]|uniref:hypothetical protein n=1 Tax=Chitinolyticbacter meiyuanensis TaxID=682798 RepID=UPI0011E5DF4D|nr:hypothetical protein [Chitinolyticbacter meiyuanensis]
MKPADIDALLALLGGIAMYNDKGYIWTNHSPEQIAEVRANARVAIHAFIARVGAENIPAAVLAEIEAAEAVEDGNGRVHETVQGMLLDRQ